MPKLRLANVEFKVCVCDEVYEGETCLECKRAFNPQRMRKLAWDRIIVIQEDPALYERAERCSCPMCENLFELQFEEVVACAQCPACHTPLIAEEDIKELWKKAKAETLLQRARHLDHARQQLDAACPACGKTVPPFCWCPLCHAPADAKHPSALPQRYTTVWVRTFFERADVEQVGRRRKKAGGRPQHEAEEAYDAQDCHA